MKWPLQPKIKDSNADRPNLHDASDNAEAQHRMQLKSPGKVESDFQDLESMVALIRLRIDRCISGELEREIFGSRETKKGNSKLDGESTKEKINKEVEYIVGGLENLGESLKMNRVEIITQYGEKEVEEYLKHNPRSWPPHYLNVEPFHEQLATTSDAMKADYNAAAKVFKDSKYHRRPPTNGQAASG
ncbi:hypothetical protein BCR34DRAFT_579822 [Clohesyomyces aquaticus]|uniref:Uncharacterized protein n=1 Tax=Clohesyomyces aquaticus TaxID=1231657 RepID=A0A1Y1Y9G7_9PLEO|nr:hypothetical protein BCR34DRAFT_579822 [Clohesyomyces aquaticus]